MSENGNGTVLRLALRPAEAAASLGVSEDYFAAHIASELRWVRKGRLKLVSVTELQAWLDRSAARTLEGAR
jgi:excisionase family DNA binding protein